MVGKRIRIRYWYSKKRAVILLLYTFFTLSPTPTRVPTQLGSKSPKHEMLRFLDCTKFKSFFCFLHTLVMSETKTVHKENSLLQRGIFSSTDFAAFQKSEVCVCHDHDY